MKLRNKIVFSIIICILIGIIPILFLVQTTVKDNNYEKMHRQTELLLDSKAKEVGSWLNQRISELRIIKENDISKNLDYDALEDYILTLNKIANESYGNISETFAIGGLDGRGIISNDVTIDVSNRKYFKEIIYGDKEYSISEPLTSKSDQKPIFIISTPILDHDNNKIGFINGAVPLKKLESITESIEFDNGFMWIMNMEYEPYTISGTSLYKKYISEEDLKSIDFKNLPGKSGSTKVSNEKREQSTLFYSKVPYTEDWVLCNLINDGILYKDTNQIISFISLFAIFMSIAAIIVGLVISRSITNPMENLKNKMIDISKRNSNVEIMKNKRNKNKIDSQDTKNHITRDNNIKGISSNTENNTNNTSEGKYTNENNADDIIKSPIKNSPSNLKDEVMILDQVFNNMIEDLKKSHSQRNLLEKEKRDAEFKTLQSQINPHFLYNTLDTISWKALEYEDMEVYEMVSSLSDFFRISLSKGEDFIKLKDEVKHVKSYLDIQKIRYKNKLDFNIYLDKRLIKAPIVKMLLQPIVENSIFHGLKEKRYFGEIKISILKDNNCILINVFDNGVGVEKEKLERINLNIKESSYKESYGLFNINERLMLIYGDGYSFKIRSKKNKFTLVTLKIPINKINI